MFLPSFNVFTSTLAPVRFLSHSSILFHLTSPFLFFLPLVCEFQCEYVQAVAHTHTSSESPLANFFRGFESIFIEAACCLQLECNRRVIRLGAFLNSTNSIRSFHFQLFLLDCFEMPLGSIAPFLHVLKSALKLPVVVAAVLCRRYLVKRCLNNSNNTLLLFTPAFSSNHVVTNHRKHMLTRCFVLRFRFRSSVYVCSERV